MDNNSPEEINHQQIPDAINTSATKNFTQIPNELLRNPNLSFKAKGILCLLLSNKEGWHSYLASLQQMTREGSEAIQSGIHELEKAEYLMRVQYRDKQTKIRRGSFWAYTDLPGNFNIQNTLQKLEKENLEVFTFREKPLKEKPDTGNPVMGNPELIILKEKDYINNNKNISKDILRNSRKEFPPLESSNNNSQINTPQKTVRRRTAPSREPPPLKEWITSGWKKTILDMWNQIPDVRKHNDLTTKTICRAAKALEHLSRGSFFDNYKISDSFISKNNIPSVWITKKKAITQRQIFTAVSKYNLYFKYGYWPTNKDSLPKSLDSFIYNEHTGGSFLLRLIANPNVRPIAEERKDRDPNPQYTKYFKEKGLLKQFSGDDIKLVYAGIRAIENRVLSGDIFVFDKRSGRNDLIKLYQVVGQGKFGKLEPMFKNYASYLSQQNRLDKEKIFSVYGYFQEFLISLRDYYSSFEVNV